ncbi:helix-turn-helix transcriptional regulator [Aliamphritea spongicola]|nr:helix-turn-helix transcriptional regulator [Aliamphritea spongicola]
MSGSVQVDDRKTLQALTGIFQGYSEAANNSYMEYYSSKDVLKQYALAHPDLYTSSITSDQVLSRSAFRDSEFYVDWVKPYGGFEYTMGACLQDYANDRMISLSLQRAADAGAFEKEISQQYINALRPHLVSAVKAISLLDMNTDSFNAAIRYLDKATLIVDDSMLVQELNPLAEDFIANHQWPELDRHNRLILPYGIADQVRQDVHSKIHAHRYPTPVAGSQKQVIHTTTSGASYSIETFPFYMESASPLSLRGGQRLALLTITPLEKQLNLGLLRKLFSFTQAELSIAALIFKGLSIRQVSEQTSRSEHTVRSCLKTIYHKAGVNRQAELVAKIASSMAYR